MILFFRCFFLQSGTQPHRDAQKMRRMESNNTGSWPSPYDWPLLCTRLQNTLYVVRADSDTTMKLVAYILFCSQQKRDTGRVVVDTQEEAAAGACLSIGGGRLRNTTREVSWGVSPDVLILLPPATALPSVCVNICQIFARNARYYSSLSKSPQMD